jgi:hypothetical protein
MDDHVNRSYSSIDDFKFFIHPTAPGTDDYTIRTRRALHYNRT